ncbi:hypothetical protein EC912_103139 [Luteibacter rhizovicinus]|uniref:Uncharacterized protein n=1 Tax=Luteibacter rhizovicinus TaxID=242606 RepID=A0A4R3YTJ8_9GAMM|nr:hypothetical protein [Luteibacter rhizovicinus]TCV94654.1 hypothetical protein EC912_103139 [Luteibacter rhizovicinus]
MNFLTAVLMRARGELDGIRPRRDVSALWLPEAVPEADLPHIAAPESAAIAPLNTDIEAIDGVPTRPRSDDEPDRGDASVRAREHSIAPHAVTTVTVSPALPVRSVSEAVLPTTLATRREGSNDGTPLPARRSAQPQPAAAAREREPAPRIDAHVEIHIGKLEIVAPPAVRPSAPGRTTGTPKPLSLSDYLDARSRQR